MMILTEETSEGTSEEKGSPFYNSTALTEDYICKNIFRFF